MMFKIGMTIVTMAGLLAAGYSGYKLWMTNQIDELVFLIVAVLFIEGAVLSFIGCIEKDGKTLRRERRRQKRKKQGYE